MLGQEFNVDLQFKKSQILLGNKEFGSMFSVLTHIHQLYIKLLIERILTIAVQLKIVDNQIISQYFKYHLVASFDSIYLRSKNS